MACERLGWQLGHLGYLTAALRTYSVEDENFMHAVITMLWDMLVHTSVLVLRALPALAEMLVGVCNRDVCGKKIVPALVTLASNADSGVRLATIGAFTTIVRTVHDAAVQEKVQAQLQWFLEEPNQTPELLVEMLRAFTVLIPATDTRLRDNYIIPQLLAITERAKDELTAAHRLSLFKALFKAFRAFDGTSLAPEAIRTYLVPALRVMVEEEESLSGGERDTLAVMLREMEAAAMAADDDDDEQTEGEPSGKTSKKRVLLNKFKRRNTQHDISQDSATTTTADDISDDVDDDATDDASTPVNTPEKKSRAAKMKGLLNRKKKKKDGE